MQPAPKAQTVDRTAGLTGFESEEHGHVLSLLLRVTLDEPNPARRPAVEDFSDFNPPRGVPHHTSADSCCR